MRLRHVAIIAGAFVTLVGCHNGDDACIDCGGMIYATPEPSVIRIPLGDTARIGVKVNGIPGVERGRLRMLTTDPQLAAFDTTMSVSDRVTVRAIRTGHGNVVYEVVIGIQSVTGAIPVEVLASP